MNYKYFDKENLEDYASGRVIYHRSGYPNFPVRLGGEIFQRCLEYIEKKQDITLYDPCSGGAYLLTTLGFLNLKQINHIIASDINEGALDLAKDNLQLLSLNGLRKRKKQLEDMIERLDKPSHKEAIMSVNRFIDLVERENKYIKTTIFKADILKEQVLNRQEFIADVVMVDVPYGNLVDWSLDDENAIDKMIENLLNVVTTDSVIAIIANKNIKVNHPRINRVKKFKIGKRYINIYKKMNY